MQWAYIYCEKIYLEEIVRKSRFNAIADSLSAPTEFLHSVFQESFAIRFNDYW